MKIYSNIIFCTACTYKDKVQCKVQLQNRKKDKKERDLILQLIFVLSSGVTGNENYYLIS